MFFPKRKFMFVAMITKVILGALAIAPCASKFASGFQIVPADVATIESLNSAAGSWRDSMEFTANFLFEQSHAKSKALASQLALGLKAEDPGNSAAGRSASGLLAKSSVFLRQNFRIAGKASFNSATKVATWGSRDSGYSNGVCYHLEPRQEVVSQPGEFVGGTVVFSTLVEGPTKLDSISPLYFCGGDEKGIIKKPTAESDILKITQPQPDLLRIELVSRPRGSEMWVEYQYEFKTNLAFPILVKLEIKSFVSGELVSESLAFVDDFVELETGPFPKNYVTIFGPVKRADNSGSDYIKRVWHATDLCEGVSSKATIFEVEPGTQSYGLRDPKALYTEAVTDMRKWDVNLLDAVSEKNFPEAERSDFPAASKSVEQPLAGANYSSIVLIGLVLVGSILIFLGKK